ncbi:MAG: hypothetical protein M9921_15115 [Fimbriimonadaceae bacterium]|nr:hypothetical protein [Chthonomonadaceae bacterium]MCO5298177.1 hypothetical protein [Fimbriimonadaceae bacterium]
MRTRLTVLGALATLLAALIALASLVFGVAGALGKGGEVNHTTAIPNLLTGIVCALAVAAFLRRRREWFGLALAGAVGHFAGHAMLLSRLGDRGGVNAGRLAGLFAVPILWLVAVLIMRQSREAVSQP